jgi:hypothetical protein
MLPSPVNGETGALPRRTTDSTQGARGWFLAGADVPDEGESQTREKRATDDARRVGEDTGGVAPTPIAVRRLAQSGVPASGGTPDFSRD